MKSVWTNKKFPFCLCESFWIDKTTSNRMSFGSKSFVLYQRWINNSSSYSMLTYFQCLASLSYSFVIKSSVKYYFYLPYMDSCAIQKCKMTQEWFKSRKFFYLFTSIAAIIEPFSIIYNMKPTETLYIDTDQSMSFNVYNKKRKLFLALFNEKGSY